jgi:hypothetical protein
MPDANLPDAVWSDLTGIDLFIPYGPSRAQLEAALRSAFGLAAHAVVDADEFEKYLHALSNHPVTVSIHQLAGPRFGWKCDVNGVFSGDMRRHLKTLAAHLGSAICALDEVEVNPDALLVFQPDGTVTTDWLHHDDNALDDPLHVKGPS